MVTQRSQGWIDGREDGAAVATADQSLGDHGNNQDLGIGVDLPQGALQGRQGGTVDDLRPLHDLTRSDVERSHVPTNIRVSDDRKKSGNRHFSAEKASVVKIE